MLFRHWNLYDAMYHSSYVASKLGIWKERGRKRLTGLLAKMGYADHFVFDRHAHNYLVRFSIPQTQQPYSHMDMDLKRVLVKKLNDVAPEYGMVELSYPSFMRCYGYHSQPLSAADAVEGISALLDVGGGVRMEVEVEGARNGGEWFGGGKVWEASTGREVRRKKDADRENVPPGGQAAANGANGKAKRLGDGNQEGQEVSGKTEVEWWVKNFWLAYDALSELVISLCFNASA